MQEGTRCMLFESVIFHHTLMVSIISKQYTFYNLVKAPLHFSHNTRMVSDAFARMYDFEIPRIYKILAELPGLARLYLTAWGPKLSKRIRYGFFWWFPGDFQPLVWSCSRITLPAHLRLVWNYRLFYALLWLVNMMWLLNHTDNLPFRHMETSPCFSKTLF